MEEKKKFDGISKMLLVLSVIMVIAGVCAVMFDAFYTQNESENTSGEELTVFDGVTRSDEKQKLDFYMITDSFAVYDYNSNVGWHFVVDAKGYEYIICMDIRDMDRYQEQYDYTYSADVNALEPDDVTIEGYVVEIEDDLKELAIDGYNTIWNVDYLNEQNFGEYLGFYYLDSTLDMPPGETGSLSPVMIAGIAMVWVGALLGLLAIRRYKKQLQGEEETLKKGGNSLEGDSYSEERCTYGEAWAEEEEFRLLPAVVGAVLGSSVGGILWILLYKIGFIAGISGYAAVFAAIWGYEKLGKRKALTGGRILCLAVGILMIVFANYVSYAWEITDVLNETAAGMANFTTVFLRLPQMLVEYDLLTAFLGELGIGAICSVYAIWMGWVKKRAGEKNKI